MTEERAVCETKEQTIFRINKNANNPFVMMDKRPIENDQLSWKAKGVLSYLLSRPDDWTVRIGDLIKRSTDGEYSTRGAIKELIDAGHLIRKQGRKDGAKFDSVNYDVYEKPLRGNPQVENPQAENLALSKNDLSKKDCNNISSSSENQKIKAEAAAFEAELKARSPEPKKQERKPVEILGVEAAIVSGRGATEADLAAERGDTIASRLADWPDDSVRVIVNVFAESYGKLPPTPNDAFYHEWRNGAEVLISIKGKGNLTQIIKSLGEEYNGFSGIVSPYSIRNAVRNEMNKVTPPQAQSVAVDDSGMIRGH